MRQEYQPESIAGVGAGDVDGGLSPCGRFRPAGAAHCPWAGTQGNLGFEDAVPAAPAPPPSGAGPAGGEETVELDPADFFQEVALGGLEHAVGLFPEGRPVAQDGRRRLPQGCSQACQGALMRGRRAS